MGTLPTLPTLTNPFESPPPLRELHFRVIIVSYLPFWEDRPSLGLRLLLYDSIADLVMFFRSP